MCSSAQRDSAATSIPYLSSTPLVDALALIPSASHFAEILWKDGYKPANTFTDVTVFAPIDCGFPESIDLDEGNFFATNLDTATSVGTVTFDTLGRKHTLTTRVDSSRSIDDGMAHVVFGPIFVAHRVVVYLIDSAEIGKR